MYKAKSVWRALAVIGLTSAVAAKATTLDLGAKASGMAIDPALGYAFIADADMGMLAEVDLRGLTVDSLPVGERPARVIANSVTHRLYVANDTSPGYVTVFYSPWNAVVARIRVGDRPQALAADFLHGELYVANRDSDSLSIVDVGTNRVARTVRVGHHPAALAVDRPLGRVYVLSPEEGSLAIFDARSREVVAAANVGRGAVSVVADERNGKAYVDNPDEAAVFVVNGGDGTLMNRFRAGFGAASGVLAPTFRRYYVPNSAEGTMTVIDTDRDIVLRTVAVGATPAQVLVDSDRGLLYVANAVGSDLAVLDTEGEAVQARLSLPASPSRVALGMDRLLVLSERDGAGDALTVLQGTAPADSAISIEYQSRFGGRDFLNTSDALEKRLVDDGLFGATWQGGTESWRVWMAAGAGRHPMCRFVSSAATDKVHFFTAGEDECAALKVDARWTYEGIAYYVALPDASGDCPRATEPLYRLYDGTTGVPRHRYVIDRNVRESMRAEGWSIEGAGADAVFACVPTLRVEAENTDSRTLTAGAFASATFTDAVVEHRVQLPRVPLRSVQP